MIYAAVMGYGTIGSGVLEVLTKNRERITERIGDEITVKYILDLREFPGDPNGDRVIHDFSVIEQDEEIEIVVEAMGGVHPAYDFVKACLLAGKHVVTSNKAVVAAHGTELLKIARERNLNFLFEASAGGGIPIIRPMEEALGGERILEISGILNGTTNYILTKMDQEGQSFEEALKKAQELGYAERNPEADVEGHDTCRKIGILTSLATGREVDYEQIYTEGIGRLTAEDFLYARELKASVKLLGSSRMEEGKVTAFVSPVLLKETHPLYMVRDVYNGVMVRGNTAGTLMFYGSGAGKLPTASAVVADMMEIGGNRDRNIPMGWGEERQELLPFGQTVFSYFLRFSGRAEEKRGEIEAAFGPVKILELPGMDEFAALTGEMTEEHYRRVSSAFGEIRQRIRALL